MHKAQHKIRLQFVQSPAVQSEKFIPLCFSALQCTLCISQCPSAVQCSAVQCLPSAMHCIYVQCSELRYSAVGLQSVPSATHCISAQYNVQCALCTVQWALCSGHCTVCNVHCAVGYVTVQWVYLSAVGVSQCSELGHSAVGLQSVPINSSFSPGIHSLSSCGTMHV